MSRLMRSVANGAYLLLMRYVRCVSNDRVWGSARRMRTFPQCVLKHLLFVELSKPVKQRRPTGGLM